MKVWSVALTLLVGMALVFGSASTAEEKDKAKEVTLKGKLVCGKCTLMETAKCSNVLQVKDGDKTVNYYLTDKGNKETYHKGSCPANSSQDATVTGVVGTKDGKKTITPSKVSVK